MWSCKLYKFGVSGFFFIITCYCQKWGQSWKQQHISFPCTFCFHYITMQRHTWLCTIFLLFLHSSSLSVVLMNSFVGEFLPVGGFDEFLCGRVPPCRWFWWIPLWESSSLSVVLINFFVGEFLPFGSFDEFLCGRVSPFRWFWWIALWESFSLSVVLTNSFVEEFLPFGSFDELLCYLFIISLFKIGCTIALKKKSV